MDVDNAFRIFNAACNVLEFLIIIWLVRDRRILIISLKRLAETVHSLHQQQPATITAPTNTPTTPTKKAK